MGNSGRNAVVTGGASGIGRAIALRLAGAGTEVALLDVDATGAGAVAAQIAALGRRALAIEADVANAASVGRAVERLHRELGPVQILVNSAGIASFAPFLDMPEADWDRMIAVHL